MFIMNKKGLIEKIVSTIAILALSVILSVSFSPGLFRLENIFEFDEDATRICIHMKDEIPKGSFAREMRLVNMEINEEEVALETYDNAGWVWHEEWGYTLYTDSKEDFVIDYNEPIKSIDFEYVKHEGSGIAEIYVGNTKIDEINMYRSRWYNFQKYYSFVSEKGFVFKYIEHTIFFMILLCTIYMIIRNILSKNENREYGVSSSLGMFDAAKGISMVLIILGHSIINTNKSAASVLLIMLACTVSAGLIPMFYIMSGYGFRGEKNISCIKKQLSYLLKPYIVVAVFTILFSVIKVVILSDYTVKDLGSLAFSFLTFSTIGGTIGGIATISVGPIWFCIELCIAWIILNFIFSFKNKKMIYTSVAIVVIAGALMEGLPYNIYGRTQFIPALFFIFVGYILREKKVFQKENKYTCLIYASVVVVNVLGIMINGVANASSNYMGPYYILGVLTSACMGVVLLRLYMILNGKIDMKLFKRIGRNTYDIIYIHNFEYLLIPWEKIVSHIQLPMMVKELIIFSLRCIMIYAIFKLVQCIRKMIKNRT